ncbi:MAG TPA: hypothetical protein PK210_05135 [Bacteroidia bacterium]|nr:hypothetical protein [Bacteroidia bacterium]
MITHNEYLKALNIVMEYKTQLEAHLKQVTKEANIIEKQSHANPESEFYDVGSTRLVNIINYNREMLGLSLNSKTKISELSKISERKFLKCRNAGKGSLKELKELCFFAGVSLQP